MTPRLFLLAFPRGESFPILSQESRVRGQVAPGLVEGTAERPACRTACLADSRGA